MPLPSYMVTDGFLELVNSDLIAHEHLSGLVGVGVAANRMHQRIVEALTAGNDGYSVALTILGHEHPAVSVNSGEAHRLGVQPHRVFDRVVHGARTLAYSHPRPLSLLLSSSYSGR